MRITEFLKVLKKISEEHNIKIFLIGGYVRDKLLKKRNKDIDIVVEYEFEKLLFLFEKYFNKKPRSISQFNTAIFEFEHFSCDIVLARKEIYKKNGSLPIVQKSNLKDDIFRRDFTINSIVYDFVNNKYMDLLNGIDDLRKGILRENRKKLFIEDPTRIFRLLKYKNRFDFNIENNTKEDFLFSLKRKNLFENVSKSRIANEWRLILKEKNRAKIFSDIKYYKIFDNIFNKNINMNTENNNLNDFELTVYMFIDNSIEDLIKICDTLLNGVKKNLIKDINCIKELREKHLTNKNILKKYPKLIKKIQQ